MGAPETNTVAAGEAARAAHHALPAGSPCPNCETALIGAWCHACGQKSEEFHRSIWHLAAEAFEGLTHFDGRFWNTLPRLVLRPGSLTRDYLDGRRASQIPPFRMFLIALLAVFLAGGVNVQAQHVKFRVAGLNDPLVIRSISPQDRAAMDRAASEARRLDKPADAWLSAHALRALENPEPFLEALEQWGHRFAILMLPVAALLLSVLFIGKRGVYVFDHLIFSMHSLAFQGLLLSAAFLLGTLVSQAWWLMLAAPVHLFFHMRRSYAIGVVGTLVRMALLFIGSTVGFGLLIAGLLLVGLATVH